MALIRAHDNGIHVQSCTSQHPCDVKTSRYLYRAYASTSQRNKSCFPRKESSANQLERTLFTCAFLIFCDVQDIAGTCLRLSSGYKCSVPTWLLSLKPFAAPWRNMVSRWTFKNAAANLKKDFFQTIWTKIILRIRILELDSILPCIQSRLRTS